MKTGTLRNTLLLISMCLVSSMSVADFDFSSPPPGDRDAVTNPEHSTAKINEVIDGLREALGKTSERESTPTADALSNMGAPEYGTADDELEKTRDKGRIGVDPAISIGGLPSIGLPSSGGGGMPGAPGGGMPSAMGGSSGAAMPGAAGAQGGGSGSQRVADLDRALDKSLEGFDGVIMDEQQQARERQQAAGGAAESGSMAGPSSPITMAGAEGEGDSGTSASSGNIAMRGDQPPMPSGRTRSAGKQGSAGASQNTAGAENDGGGAEESGEQTASNDIPDDIAPVDNNDVIGRQIQEAATAERDPMLRDKLWEELRRHQAKR